MTKSSSSWAGIMFGLVLFIFAWAMWFKALFWNLENADLIVTLVALIPPIGMIEGVLILLGAI